MAADRYVALEESTGLIIIDPMRMTTNESSALYHLTRSVGAIPLIFGINLKGWPLKYALE